MISILQLNIRSLLSNRNYLETFLRLNNIGLALLSETWLKESQLVSFSNYTIIRAEKGDGYGSSAFLIKKQINFKPIQFQPRYNNSKIQTCGVTIKIQNAEISIVSIYCA